MIFSRKSAVVWPFASNINRLHRVKGLAMASKHPFIEPRIEALLGAGCCERLHQGDLLWSINYRF
jgi:hypothetical protein